MLSLVSTSNSLNSHPRRIVKCVDCHKDMDVTAIPSGGLTRCMGCNQFMNPDQPLHRFHFCQKCGAFLQYSVTLLRFQCTVCSSIISVPCRTNLEGLQVNDKIPLKIRKPNKKRTLTNVERKAPKRPPTAYHLFCREQKNKESTGIKLAEQWKSLVPSVKHLYEQQAHFLAAEYSKGIKWVPAHIVEPSHPPLLSTTRTKKKGRTTKDSFLSKFMH